MRRDTGQAWTAARTTIDQGRAFIGPRGNDALANAFYSGYSRREEPLLYAGTSLPLRFGDRARAARESARAIREADARAKAALGGN